MQTPQSRVQRDTVWPRASGILTGSVPLNHIASRLSGVYHTFSRQDTPKAQRSSPRHGPRASPEDLAKVQVQATQAY